MYGTVKYMSGQPVPEPGEARKNYVKMWERRILADKRHWKPDFARMREDMDFAYGIQWEGQSSIEIEDRYIANITQRHINQRTSALYAKNPKVTAERKPRMDFAVWDESMHSVQNMIGMASTSMAPTPEMAMLAQDIMQGFEVRNMLKRVAKTLEILWAHFTDEQLPPFKLSMKDLVRTALICGVGYIELDFQRMQGFSEEKMSSLADARARLLQLERLTAELNLGDDGQMHEASAEMEQLRIQIQTISSAPDLQMREGLIYDFPEPLSIIPSKGTKKLRGWVGTEWITKEFIVSCARVKEWFGIDLGSQYTEYKPGEEHQQPIPATDDDPENKLVCLWKIYSKRDGLVFWLVEGHEDFLREPEKPSVDLERFYPFYVLTFNEITHHKKVFPISDVRLLRSPQKEINRKKEALRQHRIANRPAYVSPAGALGEEDKEKLVSEYPDHAIIELQGLKEGQDSAEVLQAMKKAPIDPNVYETDSDFQDVLRVVGAQEANLGGTGGDTATEVSVAEGSRMSSIESNEDDLELVLTEMARDGGNILLMNMSADAVKEIVGPGAVWPQLSPQDIKREMFLTVEAGTAGRPNRQRDLADFERAVPLLIQIPGIRPEPLARFGLRILNDKIDLTEFIGEGLPSIIAMNSATPAPAAGGAPGEPVSETPAAQGPQGAGNAAQGPQTAPGPQPAYPTGGEPGLAQGDVSS